MTPLPPGSCIGILGGGQLGRMLSLAAAPLGYACHIFGPEAAPPAGQVADRTTIADYDDESALSGFAKNVDLVTLEYIPVLIKEMPKPVIAMVDGFAIPLKGIKSEGVIKGDEKITSIAAASIVAKVSRDRLIYKMSKKFKKYYWDKNAGYGTKDHIAAIRKFGITRYHRKTFQPIHNMLSLK